MWVADMDFAVLPQIRSAVTERAAHPIYGYSIPPAGYEESFMDWCARRHGLSIEKEWMLRVTGVVTAMKAAILALTKPGDRVLVQTPVYPPFLGAVQITGRTLVCNPLTPDGEGRYRMDFDDLERQLAQGVPLMLLCSPHNPVGRVWTEEELERLLALCRRYGTLVFSDEIHWDLAYGGHCHTSLLHFEDAKKCCILSTSAGKTFNIAGLKSGFAVVPNPGIRKKLYEQLDIFGAGSGNLFGYAATMAAYQHGDAWAGALVGYLEANAAFVCRYLRENLPMVKAFMPEGTFLMWLDFRAFGIAQEVLLRMLTDDAGVIVNDGVTFGLEGNGFVRLNIACTRSRLQEGMERIQRVFAGKETNG